MFNPNVNNMEAHSPPKSSTLLQGNQSSSNFAFHSAAVQAPNVNRSPSHSLSNHNGNGMNGLHGMNGVNGQNVQNVQNRYPPRSQAPQLQANGSFSNSHHAPHLQQNRSFSNHGPRGMNHGINHGVNLRQQSSSPRTSAQKPWPTTSTTQNVSFL